jgi:hypothetical protein
MPDIAVVAGGSAGIGRAAVEAFARRGYWVAVLARGKERLESTRAAVRAAGARGSLRPRMQLIVSPLGFAEALRLRDPKHVHEMTAQPTGSDECSDRDAGDCPRQHVAAAFIHAQPEVRRLRGDDREIEDQVVYGDALRTRVMQAEQIDQARDGSEQSTDDAAA